MAKSKTEFRNYVDSALQDRVQKTYLDQHTSQTYDYALEKKNLYGKGIGVEMGIWEAAELLNSIVDESDPDVDTPQIHHCLQTAEVRVNLSFYSLGSYDS
jgi:inositol oxygenase